MTGFKPTLSIGQAFLIGIMSMLAVSCMTGNIWNNLNFETGDGYFAFGFAMAAFIATMLIDVLILSRQPPTQLNRSACAAIRILAFLSIFHGCTAFSQYKLVSREAVLAVANVSGMALGTLYALLLCAVGQRHISSKLLAVTTTQLDGAKTAFMQCKGHLEKASDLREHALQSVSKTGCETARERLKASGQQCLISASRNLDNASLYLQEAFEEIAAGPECPAQLSQVEALATRLKELKDWYSELHMKVSELSTSKPLEVTRISETVPAVTYAERPTVKLTELSIEIPSP